MRVENIPQVSYDVLWHRAGEGRHTPLGRCPERRNHGYTHRLPAWNRYHPRLGDGAEVLVTTNASSPVQRGIHVIATQGALVRD